MRPFLFAIIAALLWGALAAPEARASNFYWNGSYYVSSCGGYAYYPYKVWYYDSCGYKRWKWEYRKVAIATTCTPAAKTVNYSKDGWRDVLTQYAVKQAKEREDQSNFIEALRELGLNDIYGGQAYAQQQQYQQQQVGYQVRNQQGSTVYGYNEIADVFGSVDVGAIYNQALRLRGDSRRYEAEGEKGALQMVDNLGNAAASVAEIQAKGRAVSAALEAANAKDKSTYVSQRAYIGQGGGQAEQQVYPGQPPMEPPPGPPPAPPMNGGAGKGEWLINRVCADCHGSDKAEPPKGLFISSDVNLTDAQFRAASRAVTDGKMPPPEKVGRLPAEDRLRIIDELSALVPQE